MLERALGCKRIAGGVLYHTYFTYAEAWSWMQAHSWRCPLSRLVYLRWGVLLDASAYLEAPSIAHGLPTLRRALGCKCIAEGVPNHI